MLGNALIDAGYESLAAVAYDAEREILELRRQVDAADDHRRKAEAARGRAALYAQATRWLRLRIRWLERGHR